MSAPAALDPEAAHDHAHDAPATAKTPVPRGPRIGDWQIHRRAVTVALAVVGAATMGAAYFLPWWNFHLVSPQYAKGLNLVVSLKGISGDVDEIDIINHYIGMAHLTEGAPLERAYGGYAVALLGVMVITGILAAGRKIGWVAMAMGIGLPIWFIADTMYWLYTFGHDLDPKAPVHITPFTPTMFGSGKVGQFLTTAAPTEGFYVALVGVVLVSLAVWQRAKVCKACPLHDSCGVVCNTGFVRVPK